MEDITAIGLVLMVFGMAAKSLFDWLRQKNLQNSEDRLKAVESNMKEMKTLFIKHDEDHHFTNEQVRELHEWHDRKDADGVPVWYVRKSLEEIIKQNAEAVVLLAQQSSLQTQVLKEVSENQRDMLVEMRRLHVQPTSQLTQ